MEARFLSKVNKTDACWLWTRGKTIGGYGKFDFKGRTVLAHRIAYEMWVGPIPPDEEIRHKCDEPSCVNPAHLHTGTHQQNIDDKVEKNRQAKGEQIGKLTDDDVFEIKVLIGFGVPQRQIAKQFNMSQSLISRVSRGIAWKHI